MTAFDQELDARNLTCPLPILKAKKAIKAMSTGETLKVVATDPGSVQDFESFCQQTGHLLLESSESEGEFHFLVKRS
ncbi:MAG: sulfurtransferase TusA family protein [Pseudomonadota bacterium]